jgi:hypothetical protein
VTGRLATAFAMIFGGCNVNALGRILVPWQSITVLKRHRFATENGWQQMVSIVLDGPEIDLSIPWQSHLDEVVPKSIGIS